MANAWFGAVAAIDALRCWAQLTLDRELLDLLQLRFDYGVGTRVDVMRQQARVADSEIALIRCAVGSGGVREPPRRAQRAMPDGRPRVPVDEGSTLRRSCRHSACPPNCCCVVPTCAPRAPSWSPPMPRSPRPSPIGCRASRSDGSLVFSDTASFTGPVALIAGAFVQPLLDWGRRKAEVERNEALYRERLAAFTQQFLEAVEAVDSALVRERRQREFLQRLAHQRDILQQTVDASKDRYTQGSMTICR